MSCNDFRSTAGGSQEQRHPHQVIADLIDDRAQAERAKKLSRLHLHVARRRRRLEFDCVFMDHLSTVPAPRHPVICARPQEVLAQRGLLEKCRKQAAEDGNGGCVCTGDSVQYLETDFFYTGVVNATTRRASPRRRPSRSSAVPDRRGAHVPCPERLGHALPARQPQLGDDRRGLGRPTSPRCCRSARTASTPSAALSSSTSCGPLRRNTTRPSRTTTRGKVEDLLTPRIHNYDFWPASPRR